MNLQRDVLAIMCSKPEYATVRQLTKNPERHLHGAQKPTRVTRKAHVHNLDMDELNLENFRPAPRHSANRKSITQRSRCLWLDKDVHKCAEKRRKGEKKSTYRDLSHETGIAPSTIWKKVKAINEGRPIREKQGPRFKISLEEEQEMVKYLQECSSQNDPRTQTQFAAEIVHFMQVYQIENTFRRGLPGRGYFRRFLRYYPNAKFASIDEVNNCIQEFISHLDWAFNRDQVLLQQEGRSFCRSMKAIIMIEADEIYIAPLALTLSLMAAYASDGEIIQVLVLHKGNIPTDITDSYTGKGKIQYIQTEDGEVDYNAAYTMTHDVYRYVRDEQVELPVIMYAGYEIHGYFGYAAWKFMKETKLILFKIPRCIFNDIVDQEMGMFVRFQESLNKEVHRRCAKTPKEKHMQELAKSLCTVVKRGMTKQLKAIFVKMNMVTLDTPSTAGSERYVPYMDLNNTLEYDDADPNTEHDIYTGLFPHDTFMLHGGPVENVHGSFQPSSGRSSLNQDTPLMNENSTPFATGINSDDAHGAIMETTGNGDVDSQVLNTSLDPVLNAADHVSFDLDQDLDNGDDLDGHDEFVSTFAETDDILHQFDFDTSFTF